VLVGADEADLADRAARLAEHMGQDVDAVVENMRSRGVYGTPDQAAERLRELESAGVYRVMLQHFLHDDVEAVELMGRELIPRVSS
jgi:alkanesulfonate monooxygenase SsuD/methylene tetrahydromethanopterin reductase-like flavin-dependent oxidoreductase (luciferase family)